MNRPIFFLLLSLFFATIPLCAHADLNGFLGDLNRRATASPAEYHTSLSNQFGVPQPQVDSLMRSVATPSDAFMVLQLGKMTNKPHDQILRTYNANRGKGWGVIAQEMGIKPGSQEFHALKDGRFSLTGKPGHPSHGDRPNKHDHKKRDFDEADYGKIKDKKKGYYQDR
ncbi:MAG: hypothetical protein FWD79_11095 [Desulfobulbus sp.]|nr:hypothetical protein [Desulfobulbus sp.]